MAGGKSRGFILHDDNPVFDLLTDEELGRLIHALIAYHREGEQTIAETDRLYLPFATLRGLVDADEKRYLATCERNRIIAQAAWDERKGKA